MDESTRRNVLEGNLRVPAREVTGEEWMWIFEELLEKSENSKFALKYLRSLIPIADYHAANVGVMPFRNNNGWERTGACHIDFLPHCSEQLNENTHCLFLCRLASSFVRGNMNACVSPEAGIMTEVHVLLTRKMQWVRWRRDYERLIVNEKRIERTINSQFELLSREGMIKFINEYRQQDAIGLRMLRMIEEVASKTAGYLQSGANNLDNMSRRANKLLDRIESDR